MKRSLRTVKWFTLFCSLVLGLALGLLWVLMPRSIVEAQAVLPGLDAGLALDVSRDCEEPSIADATTSRVTAGEPPAFVPTPALPDDGRVEPVDLGTTGGVPLFAGDRGSGDSLLSIPPVPGSADLVVCLDTDRVWGVAGAGETVTVVVNGAQMGAALADGNGFFWATLYDASGERPELDGGDTVVVYHDGALQASVTLRSITGTIDLVGDVVSGTIGGISSPISVTVYAPGGEPSMTSYSQTVSTDSGGDLLANLGDVWDYAATDTSVVAYVEGGVEVHQLVYAHAVLVRPDPLNQVMGRATPGTALTATVYFSNATEKENATLTARARDGWYYWDVPTDVVESDFVAIELADGTVMSRTVEALIITDVDAGNDRVIGVAEPGATVRGVGSDLTPLGWRSVQVTTTADASGAYTLEFGTVANLLPQNWMGVYVADGEGDDLSALAPAFSVEVHQTWNEVYGRAPSPPADQSIGWPVTLTLYSTISDTSFTYSKGMDYYGWYWFDQDDGLPDIAPGDVVTVESEGYAWQGVVEVKTMTTGYDVGADRFTGTVVTPSEGVEIDAWQWQSGFYPIGGGFRVPVTATSPFTVDATGFDVRNGVVYEVRHRTADEYVEQIRRDVDRVVVDVRGNGLEAVLNPPGTAYTVTLYDGKGTQKAQLTGTSNDPIGDTWWQDFWKSGEQIEAGDLVSVQSAAGFSQTVVVPGFVITPDLGADVVYGQGPANTLLYFEVDNHGQGFVPTDDSGQFAFAVDQLQNSWSDGDLQWGDWIGVWYFDENGNRVQDGFGWPQIIANYDMEGASRVQGGGAFPGNTVYITVTDPSAAVVATGTTVGGTGPRWYGPNSYQLDLPDGTIAPSNTVTVDFGDGYLDSTEVVTITANPDVDTDIVTGTAPADSWLHANVCNPWDCANINDVEVDAGGFYTMDFGAEGWDIQYGDYFDIYYNAEHGHQTQYSFWIPAPELWVEKQTTPGVAVPGGTYLYYIRYGNKGNGVAENAVISDTTPANMSYAADTSGLPVFDQGGVFTMSLGDVPPGAYGEFYVALDVSFGVPTQTSLAANCITITTTSPGDLDPGNDNSCSGDAWADDGDAGLWVKKHPHPNDPHPGQLFFYNIEYGSNGSAATGPAWLTDTLPLSTTYVGWEEHHGWGALWTEVVTTGGQLVLHAPAGVPGDMGGRIWLILRLDDDVPIGTRLENTVEITTAGDVDPGDNWDSNDDAVVGGARYSMEVDKWFSGGVLVSGGSVQYGISYQNRGNIATRIWITDTLPEGTSFDVAWAWGGWGSDPVVPSIVTDEYVVWDLGVVEVDEGFGFDVVLDISGTVAPGAVLTNCTTVGITATESTPWDNVACVTTTVNASGPNLHVDKQIDDDYRPGNDRIRYRIQVANYGDQTVYNVRVTDTYPISTSFSGDWEHKFWEQIDFTHHYTDGQLIWELDRLEPGWSTQINFSVDLDDPGARMRWYTNTVTIDMPVGETDPTDNDDIDAVFSGGEVDEVDLNVYGNNLRGEVPGDPVTITTQYTQVVLSWDGGGGFDWWANDPFLPGDVITVAAGAGSHPVVIHVPDPFDAYASSITDTVWGQIDHLDGEWVEVDLEDGPTLDVPTDGSGNYSATFFDIPRGGRGEVRYRAEIDYAQVTFHRAYQTTDLILNVDYYNDDVHGNYDAGHTVWITVTESNSATVKATAVLTTGPIPWWGGQSGFNPQGSDWWPLHPDIVPGDWVFGRVDNGQATQLRIGEITGTVDVDTDSISGRIYAPWFTQTLDVTCDEWAGVGVPGKSSTAGPNGDPPYYCQWDPGTEWDVQPGQDIGVWYVGSDLNRVAAGFREPQPYVRVSKSANGDPAQGGNFSFNIQYWNDGNDRDYAEDVVITDTLLGGMTYITDTSGFPHTGSGSGPIVWDLGTVPGNSAGSFEVFVEVTATAGAAVTNTVQITTSSPYNQSGSGDRTFEWQGTVQTNNTQLNVGKYIRGPNPAPGTNFTWAINVCNGGSTSSSELTLTDTLPISTTLLGWQGQYAGWTEVLSTSDQLVLTYPSIQPGCNEVYLRFRLDGDAWMGMPISNTATITASNDTTSGDDASTDHRDVNGPYASLYVRKDWNQGQLAPGGNLYYGVQYGNDGSAPADNVLLTYTLPVSTTFNSARRYDQYGQHLFTPDTVTADYVVWDLGTLENGHSSNLEIHLDVDGSAVPGTVLTTTAEIVPHPSDFHYDDNAVTWVETLNTSGPNLEVHKQNYNWNGTGQIQYEIRIKNRGTERLEPVWITDTYPISTTWDGNWRYGHGPWITTTHDVPNRQILFWIEKLDPGETASISFQVDLDGSIHGTQGLFFTNTLEAPISGDVYPADNDDQVIAYAGPDVYAEKWLSGGEPRPGEIVTFTVKIGNRNSWQGMDGFYGSQVTDTLPAAMTFITATTPWDPNQWWIPDEITGTTSVRWGSDTPWSNSAWYFAVVARITDTVQSGDVITNVIEIHNDNSNDLDLSSNNNVYKLPLTILNPVFEVGKVYESSRVAGTVVTYTLTVTNVGNYVGTDVVLSDTLATDLTYGGGDGSYDGTDTITWTFSSISAGGGTAAGWFVATLPCTAGLSIVNDDYAVVASAEGVTSPVGSAVSLNVVAPTINAQIAHTPGRIVVSDTVFLTATASTDGTPLSYEWDLDGSTGAGSVASHVYTVDGDHTVVLTATDACGYAVVQSATVTVNAPALVAGFDQSAKTVVVNSTVYFTDASSTDGPPIVAWGWDFGDGGTGIGNPTSHVYATGGTYTVTLAITDSLGYADAHAVVDAIVVITGTEANIDPVTGGTLIYTDAQGYTTTVQAPGDAVTNAITLVYSPLVSPTESAPSGLAFAGHYFELEAYQGGTHLGDYRFKLPVTVTIHYADADVTGVDETTLVLEYWDGSQWLDAACGSYDYHADENWFSVPIRHLSEFAMLGNEGYRIYLPTVLRNWGP